MIALGDSVTHGWGVGEDQSWSARLQAHLAAAGHDVQVINAGVPASRVRGMASWCETQAASLEPDLLIWARRPGFDDPRPYNKFIEAMTRCRAAIGTPVLVVLPPISTFDFHGERVWREEHQELRQRLGRQRVEVVELTGHFREAQAGEGEVLQRDDGFVRVVDQQTGAIRLEVSDRGDFLPDAIYQLFEADADVREALFFDDGHPDARGYDLFARIVSRPAAAVLEGADPGMLRRRPP